MTFILADIFHSCALQAWMEVAGKTGQWPPDSELSRQRAYDLYEAEKQKEDAMKHST